MPETKVLAPLLAVLADLIAWLKAEEVAGVVIGGLAACCWGRPRLTRDVDVLVVVDESRWAGFLATGAKYGFVPRQSDTLAFAQQSRVLLMRHEPSGLDADVVFGSLPFERETVARAVWIDLGGVRVPLARPEDLIILKAVAHRPQDLADIQAILAAQPRLNLRRVRRWVQEFSEALSMPEILRDLETLLSQGRKRRG